MSFTSTLMPCVAHNSLKASIATGVLACKAFSSLLNTRIRGFPEKKVQPAPIKKWTRTAKKKKDTNFQGRAIFFDFPTGKAKKHTTCYHFRQNYLSGNKLNENLFCKLASTGINATHASPAQSLNEHHRQASQFSLNVSSAVCTST